MSEESSELQKALQVRSKEAQDRDRMYEEMQADLFDKGRFQDTLLN